MFKTQASYIVYEIVYLLTLAVLLVTLTATYIIIVIKKIASNREVEKTGASTSYSDIKSLGVKVLLMIGSQALSWCSFIFTVIYFT